MKTGILPIIYNHRHNDLHEIIAKVLKKKKKTDNYSLKNLTQF